MRLKPILQSKKFYIVLLVLIIFYVFLTTKIRQYNSIYNENTHEFIGTITKIKESNYGYTITLKAKENLLVYSKKKNCDLGDLVYIKGDLEKPAVNTLFNTFNYKEYLYQNKIYYLVDAKEIKVIKKNTNLIYKIKTNLNNYLDTFKSKIYLKSFILMDTSYLDDDIYNSYQTNGIAHLLAIGSTHLTLLSIIWLFFFKKLKLNNNLSHVILFLFVFIYMLITNFQISFVRVYLYMILSFLNKNLKLELKSLNLFIMVLCLTLLFNPFYIYNKGFLYSYSISFILILNKNKLTGNYFSKIIKVSTIAFLYSLPFNIYFNYEINLLSIFYNLFYVPIFNFIVFPLSLLTIIFPFLDNLFYLFMENLNKVSFFLNTIKIGIIILKKIPFVILVGYLMMFTYFITFKSKRFLIIIIFILLLHVHINDVIKNDFFMVIDVKQGDSSLLFIDNKAILIDTGEIYKKNNVQNTITMLKSFGIRKIDTLILTHGDYDHIGDSIYLASNFSIANVIFNGDSYNDLEQKLLKVLEEKKINYYHGLKELKLGKNELIFLNTKLYDNENDNSNVIYFNYQNYQFLLMGDASKEREKDILEKYDLKAIDFLKVGHHGSNTSSSKNFINAINPKYSLISVGKNNRYGHPKEEVLTNLSKSKIYRTDLNGSIMIKFLKGKLKIITCPP